MAARRLERPARWCLLTLAALLAGCSSSSRQLMDRAESSWRKGRYPEALEANEQLYRYEPRGRYAAQALLNIADIRYLNLRQTRQAIEFYEKLTTEFPNSAQALKAHRQLAGIFANEVIDLNQAIAQYDRILDFKDIRDRAEIVFQRADAYFKNEDYYRALRELHSLEESGISGHLADQVSLKIGSIYQIQKKYPETIEPLQKVLGSACPECRRSAVLNLTATYENLLDFDKAIETIRRLDPGPENDAYRQKEIERLNAKRRNVDKPGELGWVLPRLGDPPAAAARPATPAKRRPGGPPVTKK